MDDEAAFLRAIADAPADDAPRLVYADWLDEHDRPDRAEYLRVECRGQTRPAVERDRLAALRAGLDPAWLGAIHDGHRWPDWALVLQARRCDPPEAAATVRAVLEVDEARALALVRRYPSELRRGLRYWEAHRLRERFGEPLVVGVAHRPDGPADPRWPHPFAPIASPGERPAMNAELWRELKPGHPLFGVPVTAIGLDGDDVLFALLDGSGRIAEVHLTWAGEAERPPWPDAALFDDFAAWAASVKREYPLSPRFGGRGSG